MASKLQLGAKVVGPNGDDLGNVKFLVANRQTHQLTNLVVQKGGFETGEVVVPAAQLQNISADGKTVTVALTKDQLGGQPQFVQRQFANADPRTVNVDNNSAGPEGFSGEDEPAGAVQGRPNFVAQEDDSDMAGGADRRRDNGPDISTQADPFTRSGADTISQGQAGPDTFVPLVAPLPTASTTGSPVLAAVPLSPELDGPVGAPVTETLNVPADSFIMREGVAVEATDGSVGKLKAVNLDLATGTIDSLTVSQGLLFAHEINVPVQLVQIGTEERIYLNAPKAQFEGSAR